MENLPESVFYGPDLYSSQKFWKSLLYIAIGTPIDCAALLLSTMFSLGVVAGLVYKDVLEPGASVFSIPGMLVLGFAIALTCLYYIWGRKKVVTPFAAAYRKVGIVTAFGLNLAAPLLAMTLASFTATLLYEFLSTGFGLSVGAVVGYRSLVVMSQKLERLVRRIA